MGEDLRTIRTKKAIKQAFIDLVKEKGYKDLTVQEIALKAMVNRNTFYLHYESKDNLVYSLVQETVASQSERMNLLLSRLIINPNHLREIFLYVSFKALLKLLFEEAEFYKIFLTDYYLSVYSFQIAQMIKNEIGKFFVLNNHEEIIISEYIYNGAWGLIREWLLLDEKEEEKVIEKYANILSKLIYSNYKVSKEINNN